MLRKIFCRKEHVVLIWILFIIMSLSILKVGEVQGQESTAEKSKTVIFLMDISKSMLRPRGLFERVKDALRDYVGELNTGDYLLILTFCEEISIEVDMSITEESDIQQVYTTIDNLQATGDWTYMTKALDIAATQAKRLQGVYPDNDIIIYLLTDGKNDPPPYLQEPLLRFIDVINRHFEFFTTEQTFVYILSFHEPSSELEDFTEELREKGGQVDIKEGVPEPAQPLLQEIRIYPKNLAFGKILLKEKKGKDIAEIIITKIVNAEGKVLVFTPSIIDIPPSLEVNITPEQVVCDRKGQRVKVYLNLSGSIKPDEYGEYNGLLHVKSTDEGVFITPSKIGLSFIVAKPGIDIGKILLFIGVIVVVLLVILMTIRRRPLQILWVGVEGETPSEVTVQARQKIWLGERPAGEYIPLGLPDYYLVLGKKNTVLLCEEKTGERRKVNFSELFDCHSPEEEAIKIRFYKKKPEEKVTTQEKKEEPSPPEGPMGKI